VLGLDLPFSTKTPRVAERTASIDIPAPERGHCQDAALFSRWCQDTGAALQSRLDQSAEILFLAHSLSRHEDEYATLFETEILAETIARRRSDEMVDCALPLDDDYRFDEVSAAGEDESSAAYLQASNGSAGAGNGSTEINSFADSAETGYERHSASRRYLLALQTRLLALAARSCATEGMTGSSGNETNTTRQLAALLEEVAAESDSDFPADLLSGEGSRSSTQQLRALAHFEGANFATKFYSQALPIFPSTSQQLQARACTEPD
ncbi:unnamed protein product, partial [Amoebophrya sp. A120]